jgi:hypothetical protein
MRGATILTHTCTPVLDSLLNLFEPIILMLEAKNLDFTDTMTLSTTHLILARVRKSQKSDTGVSCDEPMHRFPCKIERNSERTTNASNRKLFTNGTLSVAPEVNPTYCDMPWKFLSRSSYFRLFVYIDAEQLDLLLWAFAKTKGVRRGSGVFNRIEAGYHSDSLIAFR